MSTTVVRNVRPLGLPPSDIVIRDGVIRAIGPGAGAGPDMPDADVIEGGGRLVFPGLIDAHTHMDKTLMGLPWHRNEVGPSLLDMVENERRVRREERADFHAQSMRHARAAIALGTTHIRTHVDVDTESGLAAFHGVRQTQAAIQDVLDIQIVAFPQSGMLVRPGTVELLDAALAECAEVMGGGPARSTATRPSTSTPSSGWSRSTTSISTSTSTSRASWARFRST